MNTTTHNKDRFISAYQPDLITKSAILDELESQKPDSTEFISYHALLQNQLLGVKDTFTIHDMNGSTDVFTNFPYSRKFRLLNTPTVVEKENTRFEFDTENVILPVKTDRKISKVPFKVLDAPALQDDFYLNLVDWSDKNALAVGLGSCVYIWSAHNSKVTKLNDVGPADNIASLSWSQGGQYLGVGTFSGHVQIWDINNSHLVKVNKGHEGRVGAISWSTKMLATGSRDKSIILSDIREKRQIISTLTGHKQEVCGLKWSNDEQQIASGGNDNKLFIWGTHNLSQPIFKISAHTAAVKALAWSPHQHALLASGGGTADRTIRFWNTLNATQINCIDTGSQVCNLAFSKTVNELVSTHGYSQNQIHVWKYPSLRKIATLTGHTFRVLYLALSSDGETIVTGAGDETLRFWKILSPQKKREELTSGMFSMSLR